MNVGRHPGNTVEVGGVVSSSGVAVEPVVLERLPASDGGLLTSFESPNGVNGRVDVARLKQGPPLAEVGQLVFDHHGFKRQFSAVGLHLKFEVRPAALEPLFAQFLGTVSEFERAVNGASVQRHGDHAVSVHFDDGPFGALGDGANPIGPGREWKEVGDDHAGHAGQPFHGGRTMTVSGQVKHVAKALFGEASVEVNSGVHHDVVVAERGVRVALVEAVVNQERSAVVVRHPAPNINHGVFMNAKQRFQPDHNGSGAHRLTGL